jgi:cytoskeletal protein CcmA (bactofilin family)
MVAEAVIGEGVRVQGEVSADKELIIAGEVSGRIRCQAVLIRAGGAVEAEVEANRVTVQGRAGGSIAANEKIEVKASATVTADLSAPSIVIEEGAVVRGSVRMALDLPEDL